MHGLHILEAHLLPPTSMHDPWCCCHVPALDMYSRKDTDQAIMLLRALCFALALPLCSPAVACAAHAMSWVVILLPVACAMQDIDIKYIDPTYMIRAIPTTTNDRIYCKVLGQGAVHGAFAGFTGCTVGLVNTHYVYLPIPVIIQVTCLFFLILHHKRKFCVTTKLACTSFVCCGRRCEKSDSSALVCDEGGCGT